MRCCMTDRSPGSGLTVSLRLPELQHEHSVWHTFTEQWLYIGMWVA